MGIDGANIRGEATLPILRSWVNAGLPQEERVKGPGQSRPPDVSELGQGLCLRHVNELGGNYEELHQDEEA